MITNYERQYINILRNIFENGFEDGVNKRTGYSTKRLPCAVIQVDVEKEFPILKSKFVAAKTALREIEWIWKQQTSDVSKLKSHIWDSWVDENNTIGKAYGAQIAKPVDIYLDPIQKDPKSFRHYDNQAQFVIEYLREFPTGRWANVTLWDVQDLKEMQLVPCCHTSTWNLDGGRLNCVLDQRSGDMPYGVPFNTTQYAELMIMIARDLDVKPGILTHVIADAYIYENQMDGVKEQLSYFDILDSANNDFETIQRKYEIPLENLTSQNLSNKTKVLIKNCQFYKKNDLEDKAIKTLKSIPYLSINTDETGFFNYDADSITIENYESINKVNFGDVAV